MKTKKIVITGGPGTGKSSIIYELIKKGYLCFEEVSRQVTLDARKKGIDQLFLTQPILFSQLLLEGRIKQFNDADNTNEELVFFDRGIPDVPAYMDYAGSSSPKEFITACESNIYDKAFVLAPWETIFHSDNERYETFDQAKDIYQQLLKTYESFGYTLIDVPFDTIEKRTDFILNTLNTI